MFAKSMFQLIIGYSISWIYFKLHSLILLAASIPIKKAPSEEQKKKVEGLMKAAHARRKAGKMKRSSVKQGRSGQGDYGY